MSVIRRSCLYDIISKWQSSIGRILDPCGTLTTYIISQNSSVRPKLMKKNHVRVASTHTPTQANGRESGPEMEIAAYT